MATIRKRQKKNGIVFDIQVRIKDAGSGKSIVKTTTFEPDPKESLKLQERAAAVFADKFEKDVKRMSQGASAELYDMNITFKDFSEEWLEKVKKNQSINYYVRCKRALNDANSFIGNLKLKDITPAVIQRYYNQLDSRVKVKERIFPLSNFKENLEEYGYSYCVLRYELDIQYCTLSRAYHGNSVTRAWAEELCKKTHMRFDRLFCIKEETSDYAYETFSGFKRVVRSMLSQAKKMRLVDDNYATADYIDFPPKPPRVIRCMDDKEAFIFYDALMKYPDIKSKTALLIFIMTGFRRGEVSGLQWKDINFEEKTITVNRVLGTASGYSGYFIKQPKTEKSQRTITMADILVEALREYKEWWEEDIEKFGDRIDEDTDWLFLQADGRANNPNTYIQWLKRILKEAKLDDYNLHSLRHTNITMQIAAGVPMVTVAARAGHARTSTTTDIYSHFIKSSDKFAAETINNLFTKK